MGKTSSDRQQVRSVQNAAKTHEWPDEAGNCTGADWSMFTKMQQQRSHDDWTAGDLITLANLSKMQSDLVEEHDQLRAEGTISYGGKTGMVKIQNPRCRVVSELASSVNSISRRLGLTAMSVADKRAGANRGQQERAARDTLTTSGNGRRSLI